MDFLLLPELDDDDVLFAGAELDDESLVEVFSAGFTEVFSVAFAFDSEPLVVVSPGGLARESFR